jgi:roadblock/LC7 domain-containing protein
MHWSWEAKICMPREKLCGHTDRIAALAFSPDGKILASASADKTIIFWDMAAHKPHKPLGEALRVLEEEALLAFSPDGKILASVDSRQHVRLWNVAERKQIAERKFEAHVKHMTFSLDGKTLILTNGYYEEVFFWDLAQDAVRREKRSISCHPDRFAFHLNDSTLTEVAKCADLGTLSGGARETNLAFSPNGKILANSRALWDMRKRVPLGKLLRVRDYLYAPVFSPDGKMLAGIQGLGGNEILLFGGKMMEIPAPEKAQAQPVVSARLDKPAEEIAAPFRYQDKYGIINARGKVVMPPVMRWIDDFNPEGLALFSPDEGERKFGVLDVYGKILIPPRFEEHAGHGWKGGGARVGVKENGVWGAVDRKGYFSERIEIMLGGNAFPGVFDEHGEFAGDEDQNQEYDKDFQARFIPFDLVITSAPDAYGKLRYGLDDKAGKRIFPPIFTQLYPVWGKAFLVFEKEGFKGLINRESRIIAHPEYDKIHSGFIDNDNNINFGNFEDPELVLLEKDGKLVFINQEGEHFWLPCDKICAPWPHHETVDSSQRRFNSFGLMYCRLNGKYGLINTKAEIVLPTAFDAIEDFSKWGIARVKRDGKEGLVDSTGELLIPPEYEHIYVSYRAHMVCGARKDGRQSVLTHRGVTIFTYGKHCAREVIYGPEDNILWPPQTPESCRNSSP